MTTFRVLKQYIEDLEAGLALRFDDLGARLEAIENNLATAKTLLVERFPLDPEFVGSTKNSGAIADRYV